MPPYNYIPYDLCLTKWLFSFFCCWCCWAPVSSGLWPLRRSTFEAVSLKIANIKKSPKRLLVLKVLIWNKVVWGSLYCLYTIPSFDNVEFSRLNTFLSNASLSLYSYMPSNVANYWPLYSALTDFCWEPSRPLAMQQVSSICIYHS